MRTRRDWLRAALGAAVTPLLVACDDDAEPLGDTDEPRARPVATPAPLALVLSSGGLRGLAHVGVLRGLQALGVEPDLIVGCSAGAVVGGLFASGLAPHELDELLAGWAADPALDPWGSWLLSPATRSRRLESFLRAKLAVRSIERFPRRFAAVATARDTGGVVALAAGDAARAVVASAALPGALAPVRVAGVELVDGGLAQPLPVRLAHSLGAARVLAVDVSWHPEVPAPSSRVGSVFHAGLLMARNLAAMDRTHAELLIEPVLPPVPEIRLANARRIANAGERAVLAAADRVLALRAGAAAPRLALSLADRPPGEAAPSPSRAGSSAR